MCTDITARWALLLLRLVSPHQRPTLCRRVENIFAHNSPYKQNLSMDNARAFVIFQKPTASLRCPPSTPAAASTVISALRRADFKGPVV